MRVGIFGAGAIGSQLALLLAPLGGEFHIWDFDRVGEENVGLSAFGRDAVGAFKVDALGDLLVMRGCSAVVHRERVEKPLSAEEAARFDLIVDTFDNWASRRLLRGANVLHVGAADYRNGSCLWDDAWTPGEFEPPEDVCTHLLGARILRWAALLGADVAEEFLRRGRRVNVVFTLGSDGVSIVWG